MRCSVSMLIVVTVCEATHVASFIYQATQPQPVMLRPRSAGPAARVVAPEQPSWPAQQVMRLVPESCQYSTLPHSGHEGLYSLCWAHNLTALGAAGLHGDAADARVHAPGRHPQHGLLPAGGRHQARSGPQDLCGLRPVSVCADTCMLVCTPVQCSCRCLQVHLCKQPRKQIFQVCPWEDGPGDGRSSSHARSAADMHRALQ